MTYIDWYLLEHLTGNFQHGRRHFMSNVVFRMSKFDWEPLVSFRQKPRLELICILQCDVVTVSAQRCIYQLQIDHFLSKKTYLYIDSVNFHLNQWLTVREHDVGKITQFLDASSHLYKRVCPSVRRSVRPSVRPSVGHAFVKNKGNQHFWAKYCHRRYIRPSLCIFTTL